MNFSKYFLTASTLCLSLALQGTLQAAADFSLGGVAESKPAAAAYDSTGTSAPVTDADDLGLVVSAAGRETATEEAPREPFAHRALGVQPADSLTNEQRKAARLARLKLDRLPISQTSSIASFLDAKNLGNFAASHKKGTSAVNYLVQGIRDNLVFPSDVEIAHPIIISLFAKAIINHGYQPNRKGKYKITSEIANRVLENARLAGNGEEIISGITRVLVASVDEYQQPFRNALEKATGLLQQNIGITAIITHARKVLAKEKDPLMQMAIRIVWYDWHKNHPMVENLDEIDMKQIITIDATPEGHLRLNINFRKLTIPTTQDLQNILDLISVLYNKIESLKIEPFYCDHEIHIIGDFPNLTKLDAQIAIKLTSIDERLIAPNLKELTLKGSGVKKISGSFPNLTTLDADNTTRLTSIDATLIAPKLETLSLGYSYLRKISGTFPQLHNIFANNTRQLTSINGRLIAPNLQMLFLLNSTIKEISGDFPQLRSILANTSQLTSIDLPVSTLISPETRASLHEAIAKNTTLEED